MRRVRFVSQYFMPEPGATSELLSGIAMELVEAGFYVDAVAGQPSYHDAGKLPEVYEEGGVRVRRVWSTQLDKNRSLGRVLNTVTFVMSNLAVVLTTPKDTLLLCTTNPPLLPWICRLASVVRGLHYVLVLEDIYPDIAVKLGVLKADSWVSRLWRTLNRWSYTGADRIRVLGRDMGKIVEAQIPEEHHDKIVVVAHWGDGHSVVPRPRKNHELIKELDAENLFIVQFSGNIGRFHEIETILDAAQIVRAEPFLFVFIGTGAQVHLVRQDMARPEEITSSFCLTS